MKMKNMRRFLAFCLLALGYACGQMTVISTAQNDPEVKPEQLTATIVHYEKMRLTARRTIRILALALQNTDDGPKAGLVDAINNQQDIADSANWCIQALRDKTTDAVACAFPTRMNNGAEPQSVCQSADDPRVRSRCSQVTASAKHIDVRD